MNPYDKLIARLPTQPKTWLVTGVASFIGSNLLDILLQLGQTVVGVDNFSTGARSNLEDVRESVGAEKWNRFRMIEGDVCQLDTCLLASTGVDCILQVYNIALHARTTLNELFKFLLNLLLPFCPELENYHPNYKDFRAGDVRHSQADISKAPRLLSYQPTHSIEAGLAETVEWYCEHRSSVSCDL